MFINLIFIFCLGLIIGSFLNVVIFRYNTGRGIGGRSGCMSCGKTLHWYELIPLLSFMAQRGMCRGCKAKLSWQYPLVELSTSMIFLALFLHFSSEPLTAHLFFRILIAVVAWCILIVIAVYDLRHKIIPDGAAFAFAFLGLIRVLISVPVHPLGIFISALLAGPILFLPFYFLWKISDGRWIGLGDGKLAIGIGWMLGLGYGVSAIFMSFWIGAVASIAIILVGKLRRRGSGLTLKSEIPFAPYLIIGFALAYFFAFDVASLHYVFGI